jgi:curved DNA-binding protein CbpA
MSKQKQQTYHDILGVPLGSSREEIRRAYRKQVRRWHPDKNPLAQADAAQRFKLVQEAYENLSRPPRTDTHEAPPSSTTRKETGNTAGSFDGASARPGARPPPNFGTPLSGRVKFVGKCYAHHYTHLSVID